MELLKNWVTRGLTEAWSRARPGIRPGLRILLYHAVGTPLDYGVPGLSLSPARFREQMEFLAGMEGVRRVSLSEPLFPEKPEETSVAVTFDDGYADNLEVAAPLLVRWRIPFTVFVVPAFIRSGDRKYLTPAQLKELSRVPGCRIGSHGMNHRSLAGLAPEAMAAELAGSRAWLEDVLGQAVEAVSYPYGSADRRVRQGAAEAGYRIGACSRTGVNPLDRDPLMLCRTEILSSDVLRTFDQKIKGGWDWHGFRHPDPLKV